MMQQLTTVPDPRGGHKVLVASVALFAVLLLNASSGVGIRSISLPLDWALFSTLLVVLPLSALATSIRGGFSGAWRVAAWVVGLGAIPVLLMALLLALMSLPSLMRGDSPGMERLTQASVGSYRAVAYQTGGGATADLGILVRQERTLVPGIKLVRELGYWHEAQLELMRVTGEDHVEVKLTGDETSPDGIGLRGEVTETFNLRPFPPGL